MSDRTSAPSGIDLYSVQDPDVRRALRAMMEHISQMLDRQQLEIDALLEMMMEKNGGSLSEFKRHLVRLQQNTTRGERIHDAVAAAEGLSQHAAAPAPGRRTPLQ